MNKLSVTPIGTCRINTPLKRAQSRFPIEINLARNYGFTHTSDEALQQLRYLQGDKEFREEVKPIVFRTEELSATARDVWHKSDLHIVEISSAKKILSGSDSVQINYIYRHFADFFSSDSRTQRFWSLVKRKARPELFELLRNEPTYRALSAEDRSLLTSLRMEQQDFAAIRADMAEMVDRLGRDTLLFVTHVNAQTPDGSTIPGRDRVIRWVRLAAQQLNVPCFDPTDAMTEYGQELALENGGLDLTHYTHTFSDRVYAAMHREHIGGLVDARPDLFDEQDHVARQYALADGIEAVMRFDDFLVGTRRLYAALRKDPQSIPLIQLRGRAVAKTGDFEGAIRDLEELDRSSLLSPEGRIALLEAYTGIGNWVRAEQLAEGLFSEEYESGTIYACLATACEKTGRLETALSHWKQAFRLDRSDLNAALKALALLAKIGENDQQTAWREEVLEHCGTSAVGSYEIGSWALEQRDDELFFRVFGSICEKDMNRAEDLFHGAISNGMHRASAACLRLLASSENERMVLLRNRLAIEGGKIASELAIQGRFAPAHSLADAVLQVLPDRLASRAKRAAEAHYRKVIRGAYAQRDYAAAIEASAEMEDVVDYAVDTALLVAISLNKQDRNLEALEVLERLRDRVPENATVVRWTGRIGALLGRYEIALPMYVALQHSQDDAAEKYRAEIVKFLETAERRALKQLRNAIVAGQFGEALDLVDRLRLHVKDQDRLQDEVRRVSRQLRVQLREIEEGESDEDGRELILALLLRIHPEDLAIMRRAALEFMRQMRFQEAFELWARLERLAPGSDTNSRNRSKCEILAERQRKLSGVRQEKPLAAGMPAMAS